MSNLWGGPDVDLQNRIDRALHVDPMVMGNEDYGDRRARIDRMVAAGTYTALSPADREWLDRAILAVSAGHSNVLQNAHAVGGDWAAEDAALDAGDPVPVVDVDPDLVLAEESTLALEVGRPLDEPAEAKALELDPDDDGWVG